MSADPALHIGEVAARTELSLRTLRHYDEIGLIRPSGRTDGGFRLYTEADVERILLIRRMKPLGYTLEQTGEVLADIDVLRAGGPGSADGSDGSDRAAARERLDRLRDDARERRERLERQVGMADEFLDLLGRELP